MNILIFVFCFLPIQVDLIVQQSPEKVKQVHQKEYRPYKLDTEYKGNFGSADLIYLRCKVTKDGEYYHYSYKAKNGSKFHLTKPSGRHKPSVLKIKVLSRVLSNI